MGNRNSTTKSTTSNLSSDNISTNNNNDDIEDNLMGSSGVFLGSDLNAEIINTFQNTQLQLQWQALQSKILSSDSPSQKLQTQNQLKILHINNEFTKWKEHNDTIQNQLDDKIDKLRNMFTDINVRIDYDVKNLEKKFDGSVPKFSNGDDSCYDARSGLVTCYKNNDNIQKCDAFVKAMERCTKQAVMNSS